MEFKIDKKNVKQKQDDIFTNVSSSPEFKKLVNSLKISKEDAYNNAIKLEDTIEELNNCKNCNSLYECHNKVKGHVFFPEKKESKLLFSYVPCKYEKKAKEKIKETSETILDGARIKDIKATKNRVKIIKWIKNYYDNFDPYTTNKGLYLHGNFGTGKTYLLAALLNELKNKYKINTELVYVPELLRKLKDDLSLMGEKVYYLENIDVLLLDDIGAEKVTEWGRDEIIGSILQTRMNKGMPTFFTSNLSIIELERHLSITKDKEDVLKAKRIIERIKFLTDEIELLGNNYRE